MNEKTNRMLSKPYEKTDVETNEMCEALLVM